VALDVQGGGFSLFIPHGRGEVGTGVQDFVLSLVNEEVTFLHLGAKFTHHDGRLGLVLIGLYYALVALGVVRSGLIGLRESMMVGLSRFVAAKPADIRLHASLLLHLHSHDFDLIVCQAYFDFEHIRHHKLVCLNRVKVVLLLLSTIRLHHLPGYVNLVVLLLLPI